VCNKQGKSVVVMVATPAGAAAQTRSSGEHVRYNQGASSSSLVDCVSCCRQLMSTPSSCCGSGRTILNGFQASGCCSSQRNHQLDIC
jgi:hypothetical protein